MERLYGLALLICVVAAPPEALAQHGDPAADTVRRGAAPPDTARVVLLGTGTPNADPERSGPAVAVVSGGQAYLVDCGPGVVRRAAAARAAGVEALAVDRLTHLFITHLHSDHTLGCPDLIFSPWTLEREAPLRVWGPPGTRAMMEHLQAAYSADVRIRLDGLEPANETGYQVEVTEIEPGTVYQDDGVRVTAFAVRHGSVEHAFGYRFDTPDRRIVISGDTAPDDRVAEQCDGCDVLVHEVYSDRGFRGRPPVWQRYHSSFHTSASALGELAGRARPGLLVLYHQLFWGASDEELEAEVRRGWDGPVVSGRDLDVY